MRVMKPQEVRARIQFWLREPDERLSREAWWVPVKALDALFVRDTEEARLAKRHTLLKYLVGKDSVHLLTQSESEALVDWATSENAAAEAMLILDAGGGERGQMSLL